MGSCFSTVLKAHAELDSAIRVGHCPQTVEPRLRRIKDINAVLPISRMTALELSVHEGRISIMRLVLDMGADMERKSNASWTPLLRACNRGCLEAVKLLTVRGTDMSARTLDGRSCLSMAAKNKHHSVVSYLMEQKSCSVDDSVDADGYTLLHHVVLLNDSDLVSTLISKGVDVNAQTQNGESPLFLASRHNCTESLRVLIDSGAYPNICTKDGESPLCTVAQKNNVQAIDLLLTIGADTEQTLSNGWTPLLRVCFTGCLEAVKSLVENGADIQARTPDGLTCLFVAAKNKHRSIVLYLLKQESCPIDDVDADGYTLLHHVVMLDDPVATSTLISKGLDVDAKTQDGETPVFLATKHNCVASLGVLLRSGADPNIKTKNGDSALEEAAKQGRVEMVLALQHHGADASTFNENGDSPFDLAMEVVVERILNKSNLPSIPRLLQQGDKPSALENANTTAELASNIVGLVGIALGG